MRLPKPYWKKSHNCWYADIDGKTRRLDPDETKAKDVFKKLLAESNDHDSAEALAGTDATVQDLIEEFLAWTEKHREPLTLKSYQRYFSGKGSFSDYVGPKLRIRDLKPFHVTRWLDERYAKAGSTTIAGAITAIKRAFNWGVEEGYIKDSPVGRVKKPARNNRGEEAYFLPDQWTKILAEVKPGPFRDLITVMKETGCRPQEIKIVGKRHFNQQSRTWVFAKEESKGRKEQRVVPLKPYSDRTSAGSLSKVCTSDSRQTASTSSMKRLLLLAWLRATVSATGVNSKMH